MIRIVRRRRRGRYRVRGLDGSWRVGGSRLGGPGWRSGCCRWRRSCPLGRGLLWVALLVENGDGGEGGGGYFFDR